MEKFYCRDCKTEKDKDDMFFDNVCDDCFDKRMEDEEKDFDAYYSQNCKCANCGHDLWTWHVVNGKAVCCDCNDPGEPPIEIKLNTN